MAKKILDQTRENTRVWWDNFMDDVVVSEEWKENFRMLKENFLKLRAEL